MQERSVLIITLLQVSNLPGASSPPLVCVICSSPVLPRHSETPWEACECPGAGVGGWWQEACRIPRVASCLAQLHSIGPGHLVGQGDSPESALDSSARRVSLIQRVGACTGLVRPNTGPMHAHGATCRFLPWSTHRALTTPYWTTARWVSSNPLTHSSSSSVLHFWVSTKLIQSQQGHSHH